MASFYLYSFGCKVNQAEGEEIALKLFQQGWKRVYFPSQADALIVNTCAVTSEAERKARKLIRKLKKENPESYLVVTGCYAELLSGQREPPLPFDLLVPQKSKNEVIKEFELKFRSPLKPSLEKIQSANFPTLSERRRRSRVFIKVQDGCSHFCSYCIVPHIRGKERSVPLEEVLMKVREVSDCFGEVVLCGIRLGCYGRDLFPSTTLVALLQEILKKTPLKRIRLSSLEPNDLSPELLDLVAQEKRIAPHFHLPLQSGDDEVLKKMNRPYTLEEFIDKAQEIKKKIPEVSLMTDILLGFSGESNKAFLNTEEAVKKLGFSRLHLFKFSPRPGTQAYYLYPRLPESVVHQRLLKMRSLDLLLRKNYASRFVGKVLRVLVERKINGWYEGLSDNYLRVYFPAHSRVSEIVKVKVEKEKEGVVFGKILKNKEE